jgi:hypothetical protein
MPLTAHYWLASYYYYKLKIISYYCIVSYRLLA